MSNESTTSAVEYKPIDGFPGYRVGDDGTVWSCLRIGNRPIITNKWRELAGGSSKGYRLVILCSNGIRKTCPVHLLVLNTFVGPCPEGMEACHGDGNRKNNAICNLRWGTRRSNVEDRIRHGTIVRGEKFWSAKLDADKVISIRQDASSGKFSYTDLAKKHCVCKNTIANVIKRLTWKHIA